MEFMNRLITTLFTAVTSLNWLAFIHPIQGRVHPLQELKGSSHGPFAPSFDLLESTQREPVVGFDGRRLATARFLWQPPGIFPDSFVPNCDGAHTYRSDKL